MNTVRVHEQDGIFVVGFRDRELTDDEQINQIVDELVEVLTSASSGTRLAVDFQDVEQVSSLMLSGLVMLHKNASQKGVLLQLFNISSAVLRSFETCQLHHLFEILDDPPV